MKKVNTKLANLKNDLRDCVEEIKDLQYEIRETKKDIIDLEKDLAKELKLKASIELKIASSNKKK
jgi:predicted  nucleic acid-binding Zn-ribbon protein